MRSNTLAALAAAAAVLPFAGATHLKEDALNQVMDVMFKLNNFSWENGTMSEALLEWKYPDYSVFSPTAPLPLPDGFNQDSIPDVVKLAQDTLINRPRQWHNPALPATSSSAAQGQATGSGGGGDNNGGGQGQNRRAKRQEAQTSSPVATPTSGAAAAAKTTGALNIPLQNTPTLPHGQPLLRDDAAGDPPSLGVAVVLADRATGGAQVNSVSYMQAAQSQIDYLLYGVPRTPDGAISHRAKSVQLWADNVYMVPPFLAYFGAITNNQTLVQEAFDQIRLYRQYLMNNDTKLWAHMTKGPEADDPRPWATGNAWAAAGILRVLATIKRSPFAGDMGDQQTQLQSWAAEILSTADKYKRGSDGLLFNYMDNKTTFVDSCATALMASAGYRMSTLNLTNDYVNMASTMLTSVSHNVNSTGYLNNVTDPLNFVTEGTYSPEGQSFVLMAYAAYNEWDKMGKPGNTHGDDPLNGAPRVAASLGAVALSVAASLFLVL